MSQTGAMVEDEILVFDNFLTDPMALRQAALEAEYPETEEKSYFPGRNSRLRYVIPGLNEHVARIARQEVTPTPGTAHGRFRVCLEGELGRGGVHIDQAHWSGVYYLTLDEHAQGGTDFYRFKENGKRRAPIYPEEWADWKCKTADELWDDVLRPGPDADAKWELWRHVPMKFNRLILFRPWMFHNAGPGFGDSVDNCRLVYLIFFDASYNTG